VCRQGVLWESRPRGSGDISLTAGTKAKEGVGRGRLRGVGDRSSASKATGVTTSKFQGEPKQVKDANDKAIKNCKIQCIFLPRRRRPRYVNVGEVEYNSSTTFVSTRAASEPTNHFSETSNEPETHSPGSETFAKSAACIVPVCPARPYQGRKCLAELRVSEGFKMGEMQVRT
jgi:hypothetical protein